MLRIKEAREARGWTQEQLAAAMNTTQQTIQRWESGHTLKRCGLFCCVCKTCAKSVRAKQESAPPPKQESANSCF